MANLSREQEEIDRAHAENKSTCLPNCNRYHTGDIVKQPTHRCNYCERELSNDREAIIAHNEYHLADPTSITK